MTVTNPGAAIGEDRLGPQASLSGDGWRELGARLRALREAPVLRGLPQAPLRELADAMSPLVLPPGSVVCREGDPADRLFALVSGRWDHPGALAGAGAGEDGGYAATVRTLTPARVWALPVTELERMAGDRLSSFRSGHGLRVDIDGVSLCVQGRRTLRDISLTVAPGELVAIAGSSGAGKTMLLDTAAGLRVPAEGSVRYDGVDCHANLDAFRSSLGYVPQDDIIHLELPLHRTLRHAGHLRLPAGTPPARIDQAVRHVLDVLGLTDRAGAEVGSLSGGERKRASIAVELLTAPRVFFLDEPTSGLDPATAADFMRLLRRLADDGTTVILTTHNLADVGICDKVVFLAEGGHLAFAGPPGRVCEYFGTTTVEDVYERLAYEDSPDVWHRRFITSAERTASAPLPAAAAAPDPADPVDPVDPADPADARQVPQGHRTATGPPVGAAGWRPAGAVRQWLVLTHRSLDLMVRNKLTLAILLGSPVMVLMMFVVLFRPHAFSAAHPSPNTTLMTVFWIAFGGFFFGLTYGLPQICAELAILRRERLVGVRLGPYVLSKLAILVPLLAVVDAATLGVLQGLGRLPAAGWGWDGSEFMTLLLASTAALALGLLTSAAVSGPAQAMVAMPMLCFPQVLFSGAILSLPLTAAIGRAISYAMSDRWAFEALGHGTGLAGLWAHGGSPLGPPLLASYGDTFSRPVWADWAILSGFTVALLAATCVVLGLRCGSRARNGAGRRSAARSARPPAPTAPGTRP